MNSTPLETRLQEVLRDFEDRFKSTALESHSQGAVVIFGRVGISNAHLDNLLAEVDRALAIAGQPCHYEVLERTRSYIRVLYRSGAQSAAPAPEVNDTPDEKVVTPEHILARIEKLVALAEHPNTGDPERELAWDRVHMLLARYSLTLAEVRRSEGVQAVIITHDMVLTGRYWEQSAWRAHLTQAVASVTLTHGYTMGNTHSLFVGEEVSVQAACVMMTSLLEQLQAAYQLAAAETPNKGVDGMAWKKTFLVAAARRLRERADRIAGRHAQETALVVIPQQDAHDRVAEAFNTKVRSRPINGSTKGGYSLQAARKGREAGDNADFRSGITPGAASDRLE